MVEPAGKSVECPLCEETFDPSAAGGWCTNPECGEWQYDAPGEHGEDANGAAADTAAADEGGDTDALQEESTSIEVPARSETRELTECPGCGADVVPADNFCAVCGQDLEVARERTVGTECPECGAEIESGDSFCSSCGESLETHRPGGMAASVAPKTLVLATRGEEIAVTDGDTIGRELRRVIIETGGDEDQAVRVHREHLRFVRENGQFYVVNLGTNPTRVNGQPMRKGDREPISPGDEIELSGVVGLVIREP